MEDTKIRDTIRTYLEGATYADADKLRAALHPEFRTTGHYQGRLIWSTLDDAIAACETGGLEPEAPMPRWSVDDMRIIGDTALALVTSSWNGMDFAETLTLVKSDDRWLIVFKAFHIRD